MTPRQELDNEESRRKLAKALEEWYTRLNDFMPIDSLEEPLESDPSPEKQVLRLPSDYSRDSYERLGLLVLANTEALLRVAQCHDAIKKLRSALGLKSFMIQGKYTSGGGQRSLTRSESDIGKAQKQVDKWKDVYRRAWGALGKLRGEGHEDSTGMLRRLEDDDLVMLSQWMEDHRYWREEGEAAEARAGQRGEGRRTLPWIWKNEFPIHMSGDTLDEAVEKWRTDGE